MTSLTPRQLLQAWDAQQKVYIEFREERTRCMMDVLAGLARELDHPLRVLDVCCGPGSLSNAVTQRFGDASCVGIDRDPVLMRLFRETTPHPDRIEIVDVDLREPGWAARWAEEPFDAAVSATALHWFEPDELTRVHQDIASVLAPGGILLNADHLFFDKATEPFLAELAPAERDRTEAQMRHDGSMSGDRKSVV